MKHLVWLGLLAAGWLAAGTAAAQDEYPFDVKDRNNVTPIRDGTKSFKDTAGAQESVNKAARWAVLRITDPVNRGQKVGASAPVPMSVLFGDASNLMVNPAQLAPKPLTEGQKDYVQALGKAAVGHLRTVLGTKDKPSPFELIVRVNAARILAAVGRSGYEESADLAMDVIENPNESDAVRMYALQTLRLLLAVPNLEDKKASAITKADRELKVAQTLIAFIGRQPPLTADATAEQYEAIRYVRREAIRALGLIRKPIIRKDKAVVAEPALWLLKVAAMDEAVPVVPGLAERVEAVIGYFQLNADRTQNIDYAIQWTGAALVDFAGFAKTKPDPKLEPPEPMPGKEVGVNEYYGWKFASARLLGAMKDWKDAWETEHPNPPKPQGTMVIELVEKTKVLMLDPILSTAGPSSVESEPLSAWWTGQKWPNALLYKENPKSIVTPIKRDQ